MTVTIVGRSSSHFTRVTRMFAAEAQVEHTFEIVRDLMSTDPRDYGDNPALKMPTLRLPEDTWFGALQISRELVRRSARGLRIVWPEDLTTPQLANAQELVTQAMATEVALIMGKASGAGTGAHHEKMTKSLTSSLAWLDANVAGALAALPAERDLSYLEVTLYCLTTHLTFRDVLPVAPYAALGAFADRFAARPSAEATHYRFDA